MHLVSSGTCQKTGNKAVHDVQRHKHTHFLTTTADTNTRAGTHTQTCVVNPHKIKLHARHGPFLICPQLMNSVLLTSIISNLYTIGTVQCWALCHIRHLTPTFHRPCPAIAALLHCTTHSSGDTHAARNAKTPKVCWTCGKSSCDTTKTHTHTMTLSQRHAISTRHQSDTRTRDTPDRIMLLHTAFRGMRLTPPPPPG